MNPSEYSCPENIDYSVLADKFAQLSGIMMDISEEFRNGVCSKPTCNLYVLSTEVYGVSVASTTGHGGITFYEKTGVIEGTEVNLSVPDKIFRGNGYFKFSRWTRRETNPGMVVGFGTNTNICFNMSKEYTYITAEYNWVQTISDLDVVCNLDITAPIYSNTNHDGRTSYSYSSIPTGTLINLYAPEVVDNGKYIFREWRVGSDAETVDTNNMTFFTPRINFEISEQYKFCKVVYDVANEYYYNSFYLFKSTLSNEEKEVLINKYKEAMKSLNRKDIEQKLIDFVENGEVNAEEAIFLASYFNVN